MAKVKRQIIYKGRIVTEEYEVGEEEAERLARELFRREITEELCECCGSPLPGRGKR